MRFTQLFTKTTKDISADETAINAQLLTRAGFIHKIMAGVYAYLPLGQRVLDKINSVIREEMNSTGAQEVSLSVLQNKETWMATGRWDSAKDIMYQFKDASGRETGLGWTHEEPLTEIARHHVSSYKDLPKAVYQIQTKFRNEPRAKSGLLRGREFIMKDLYSFHTDESSLDEYYEKVAMAYTRAFERVGLKALRTKASGGVFSKGHSDEYQVLSDVGEDTIFYTDDGRAWNAEIATDSGITEGGEIKKGTAIEVGNIFKLGTKFSEAFGLSFTNEQGEKHPVIMASYGWGPSRVMGTIVEMHHDDKGIIWPEAIAPFRVHLVALAGGETEADTIYADLVQKGVEVLYDDRSDKSAGEKFADADLIGCPIRMVVSKKTLEKSSVEIKKRSEKDSCLVPKDSYFSEL